jgi:hypothetical protein
MGYVAESHPGDMTELSPTHHIEVERLFYAVGRANFPADEGVYLNTTEARLKST